MEVHRSRFVPYPTPAINAVAFSHSTHHTLDSDKTSLRLAIGRANGDIEIWNPLHGAWVQETIFHGGQDRSVEGLTWIQEPDESEPNGEKIAGQLRLFSIGYATSITEWNLGTGLPLRHAEGNGSEPWCIAAQPPWKSWQKDSVAHGGGFQGQYVITGCANGTIAMFNTQDNELSLLKTLGAVIEKKARVLSVAWQNRKTVVAGYADSTIRIFNTAKKGSLMRTISLGSGPKGAPKETLVWTVSCLPNGDIVSGDSLGDIRLYEGKHYSQVQQLSGHDADVLDIAVGGDYNTLFSVGMDRRTILWKVKQSAEKGARLVKQLVNTHHEHDIKSLSVFDSKQMSVVASGGLDPDPVILPLREYQREEHRRLSGLPQIPPMTSAPSERLVASWWSREVRIWKIQPVDCSQPLGFMTGLIARIAIQGEANITSVSMNHSGRLLAVSTAVEVKLFEMSARKTGGKDTLRVRKIETHGLISYGARSVQLSPNGKWLAVISHNNDVSILRMTQNAQDGHFRVVPKVISLERIDREIGKTPALRTNTAHYGRTTNRLQFSEDSNALAVADLAGYIDTWLLEGNENPEAPEYAVIENQEAAEKNISSQSEDESDEEAEDVERVAVYGQTWIQSTQGHLIPKFNGLILVLSFRPQRPGNAANPSQLHLFVLTAKHQTIEFDIRTGQLTSWSRRNDSSKLPKQFRDLRDRAMGCVWHVTDAWSRIWIYGSNWLHMFDLDQDFCSYAEESDGVMLPREFDPSYANAQPLGKKRKLFEGSGAGGKNSANRRDKEVKARKLDNGTWESVDDRPLKKEDSFDFDEDEMDVDLDVLNTKSEDLMDDSVQPTIAENHLNTKGANGVTTNSADMQLQEKLKKEDSEVAQDETIPTEMADLADIKSLVPVDQNPPTPYFYTYKYRPILGIVPINAPAPEETLYTNDSQDKTFQPQQQEVEVVLVERPIWDLDLPPRFKSDFDRTGW